MVAKPTEWFALINSLGKMRDPSWQWTFSITFFNHPLLLAVQKPYCGNAVMTWLSQWEGRRVEGSQSGPGCGLLAWREAGWKQEGEAEGKMRAGHRGSFFTFAQFFLPAIRSLHSCGRPPPESSRFSSCLKWASLPVVDNYNLLRSQIRALFSIYPPGSAYN